MYNLVPGKGSSQLPIGASIEQVIQVLGRAYSIQHYEDELADFESAGYEVSKFLVFEQGFDEVFLFKENPLAVWKVYFTAEKVVYMNHSAYIFPKKIYQSIQIDGHGETTLGFDDSLGKAVQVLGEGYQLQIDELDNRNYIYRSKGIMLVINEDMVKNIMIFSPLNA